MKTLKKAMRWTIAMSAAVLLSTTLLQRMAAQDQPEQDDPPSRVARLGYMQGAISFQPAGESEWVEAVQNRPLTTGDKIWADRDSRAELQLGSAVIDLNGNTGFSFLNLDDRTVQIQLSSGSVNVVVRRLTRDDVFEIDTPNQAFSIFQPGRYRVEASEDGSYTVVSVREGEGESTGNGQTYTLHAGQQGTFEGTDSLNAQVEDIGAPDDFDNWSYDRYHRYDNSRSAQYVAHDVVGYEDLDDNGDWRPSPSYGNVWYPRVAAGWAPYRDGHWAWIDPWGWTWVDDEPWGYAPFHYGRWMSIEGRWGWLPGPREVAPVYAPALVVFVGGGGIGFGGNVGWFPLGPREVYVPSYRVSRGYVNRVNVSNTTVNTTVVTNVYNTTIVHNNTNITNVTYVNRGVSGAVTAVPQRSFASAQPVARSAVRVDARELAAAPIGSRAALAPTSNSVLGARANTANRVAAPPAAVSRRPVVAKAAAPPPPVPFAARQQELAAHPGQPIARQEMQRLRPASAAREQPLVKQAPPGKPATPTMGRPDNHPANANQPANRPGNPPAASNERPGANPNAPNNQPTPNNRPAPPSMRNDRPAQPGNRPELNQPQNNRPEATRPQPNQPTPDNRPGERPVRPDRPPAAHPGNLPAPTPPPPTTRPQTTRPQPKQPAPDNRPVERPVRPDRPPAAQPGNRPEPPQPNNRPEATRPQPNQPTPDNRPVERPVRPDRPSAAQPGNRPEPPQPNNRPEAARPQPNQPAPDNRPVERPVRPDRPPAAQPNNRPEPNRSTEAPPRSEPAARPPTPPAETRPAPPQQRQATPEEKKRQDEQRKQDEKRKRDEKPPAQ